MQPAAVLRGLGGLGGKAFVNGGTNQTNIAAIRAGDGQVCITYRVVPLPTIVTVAPNQGPPGGGQFVTITGTNLTGASAVGFGGTPAASFTVNGATSITATTPPRGAGAADVVVTTPGGSVRSIAAYLYVLPFLAIPTLSDWGWCCPPHSELSPRSSRSEGVHARRSDVAVRPTISSKTDGRFNLSNVK